MKVSMMQVALATAMARAIAHYPYSITDSVVHAVSSLTNYHDITVATPIFSPFRSLASGLKSKLSQLESNLHLSKTEKDAIKEDIVDAVQGSDTYMDLIRKEMKHNILEKKKRRSVNDNVMCSSYYAKLFHNGDRNNNMSIEIDEFSNIQGNGQWLNGAVKNEVMLDFRLLDVNGDNKIDFREWTSLAYEMLPVEMGLNDGSGSTISC